MNTKIKEIKARGWSAIQLTAAAYRGAVQEYKNPKGSVAVMFYMTEAFVVEDAKGLFGVKDLVYSLIKEKSIDLEATGCIQGLKLIGYIEDDVVTFMPDILEECGIDTEATRRDITDRLRLVSQLAEQVEVPM